MITYILFTFIINPLITFDFAIIAYYIINKINSTLASSNLKVGWVMQIELMGSLIEVGHSIDIA